jgi:cell wall-associated NlpC family hydrolase
MKKAIIFLTAVSILLIDADAGLSEYQNNKNIKQQSTSSYVVPFMQSVHDDRLKIKQNTKNVVNVVNRLKNREHKTKYVFSGSNPLRGWDCSGLVVWTYKQLGYELPHSANKQGNIGYPTRFPKIGDIVVFGHSKYHFEHSGIYVGNNKIINANRYHGTTVVESISSFKMYSYVKYIRVIKTL